ncbi:MAG: metallophosphoesterase family protein [bacterium]
MRYALVSDIHANIQAWKMVYEDIQKNSVDRIICLGDVIGYGPNPAELLWSLKNKVDAFVLGNHDAALCGKLDDSLFNDDARRLLAWTRKQLNEDDLKFIRTFPLTLIGDGFRCSHSEFSEPASFDYVLEAAEALPSWKATDSDLLIVGHTHERAIFVLGNSGIPRVVEPQDFTVDAGKRYFVNVGSVGQPRGKDHRASYCIYDTETRSIYWRRVMFDVEAYRKALKATGLTLDPSYYLPDEPTAKVGEAPAKRRIVFTPPKSPDKAAHDVVAVQDLKSVPPRKKKMPYNLISIVLIAVLLAGAIIWRTIPHATDINAASALPLPASERNVLTVPDQVLDPGQPIAGWDIHLEDKYRQRVGVNLDPFKQPFPYLVSKNKNKEILLSSSWIAVQPRQTWRVDASFQKKSDFSGAVALEIILQDTKHQIVSNFFIREPGAPLETGLSKIQEKIIIPEGGTMIRAQVRGKFEGNILVRHLQLNLPPTAGTTPVTPTSTGTPAASDDKWTQKVK